MKFAIVCLEKKLKKFEPIIRSDLRKLVHVLSLKKDFYLEIYLTGPGFMKRNVLSYPAPEEMPRPDIKGKMLGEIYLNPLYIKRNQEDLSRMLVHGFLHLLGFNHKRKSDRIKMEKKEQSLLKTLNPKP